MTSTQTEALAVRQARPVSLAAVRLEAAATLLAAASALLLLWVAYVAAWPLVIDVGGNDNQFARGFHEPQQADGRSYRWTDGDSTLLIPRPPVGAAGILRLELLDGQPQRAGPLVVHLDIDDVALTELVLHDNLRRSYALLLAPGASSGRALAVRLQSDAPLVVGDGRNLGVVVFGAGLAPLQSLIYLPSIWLALWAAALGGLTYAATRALGVGRVVAAGGAAGGAALVALGIVLRPLEVLPFLPRFAGMGGVAVLGIVIARLLVPPVLVLPDQRAGRPGPLVPGAYLAIHMGIAYWMLVLYQQVMIWDGATGIGALSWTVGVGLALALAFGVGLPLWWMLRGRHLPLVAGRTRLAQIALVLLALAAATHIAFSLWYAFTRQAPDFWIIFRGARAWMRGGSLYDLEAVALNHFGHVFKVPPFYGMLFVPLVRYFDGLSVLFAHRVLNVLLLVATALIWLRMWRIPLCSLAAAALLIVFNFRPLVDTIAFGQIDLVLLFLLTAALWALRAEHDSVAGALVALGTLFKLYPVVLLAFFVLKRRWAGLWGFALGMLVFNGIALAVMGWELHRVYLFEVLPRIGGTTSWVENQTIAGFVARLVASPTSATIFQDQGLRLLGTAISALVVLAVCALALLPAERRSPAYALQYGLFLLLMVLCVPAAWMHYETLLVVPFAALLLELRERQVALPFAVALGLSFGLIAYGNQWSFYSGVVMGVLTVLGVSYKLYGMLLLGALAGVALLSGRQAVAVPAGGQAPTRGLGEAPAGKGW